ncbi:OmpP1/FadL family transporter [Sandaracinus amylolyticus]|uniref:OmpP1/FadL family transporter n=1 Tax=Sandaracinus amylolyticus TaxID=927083 RepID=UPI001F1E5B19|nr:outer membrane protein transport protein [Sandaracinus amylolyticus]
MIPAGASAGGFEFAAHGTRQLGRGGAWAARADDPLALYYNPAMLADLPDSQVLANVHVAFWDACVDRPGTYASAIAAGRTGGANLFDGPSGNEDAWLDDEMPTVCNSGYPQPVPWVLGSIRLLPELGIAFGIIAPSGIGNATWGNTGDRRFGTVDTANGLRPSPVRYGLAQQDVLLAHPSIGVGWRPADFIRIGFTFQWGVANVHFMNFTSAGVGGSPEDPFGDIRTELSVFDWFVPAGILSVHLQPHPNFDIMVSGRISDAIGGATEASGHLNLTTSYFSNDPTWMPTTTRIDNVTLRAGQPWQFQLAMRYADRIRPRSWEGGFEAAMRNVVDDAMYSENFDIELDVVYELNSQVGDFVVNLPSGSSVVAGGTVVPVPAVQPIPHGWGDVLGIRLGGDWNIIPGAVAARAGFHTEIPITQSRYQIQDFLSGYRFGLHVGATFRIERFDISIAYAHIFQLDTTITDGNFRAVSANNSDGVCAGSGTYDPNNPVVDVGCYPQGYGAVTNNGTYTAEFNVLSVGATYHFE